MRAKTRNRLWSAMLWTALAAVLLYIVATARAFDASILLPVMDAEQWTPAKLNPVAWWQGEDDATDSTGAYDGAWSGTETYAEGKVGRSMSLNGSSSIAATGVAAASSATVAMWVKTGQFANTATGFFLDIYTAPMRLLVASSSVAGRLVVGASNAHVSYLDSAGIGTGWTHIAYTISGGVVTAIYVNGAPKSISGTADPGDAFTSGTKIGRANLGTAYFATGQIDDVLIFSPGLTSAELSRLYSESVARDGEAW